MAWTAPRDWSDNSDVPDGIVTAAMLNVDVRDNLLTLSEHSHTGSAGQGASSMSGLTLAALATLTFADQSANPDAAGELQRNGNDLLFYGASVVNLTAADQASGTASLRSLSTTSTTAAAGDHTHTPASEAVGEASGYTVTPDSETDIVTLTATPGAATPRSWAIYCAFYPVQIANGYTLKLYYDAAVLETATGAGGGLLYELAGFQAGVTVEAHTIKLTGERTSGGGDYRIRGTIGFREVSG